MKKETFQSLESAISDVGYWRWWITDDDVCQLEFGGVQMLDSGEITPDSKSAVIALRFSVNSFLIFYDDGQEEKDWYTKLHNDEIEPFTLDYDFCFFNQPDRITELNDSYKNKYIIKEPVQGSEENIILAFKAGNIAVTAGGSGFHTIDGNGIIPEEEIEKRRGLWWEYWKDYWKKRDTAGAYKKDYVCEVTIPVRGD